MKDVNVDENRIVHNGKLWSSGGVTSGLDLCLAFICNASGESDAGKVQLLLEYFPPTLKYTRLSQIQELPPIRTPNGLFDNGMQRLPNYVLESYFQKME